MPPQLKICFCLKCKKTYGDRGKMLSCRTWRRHQKPDRLNKASDGGVYDIRYNAQLQSECNSLYDRDINCVNVILELDRRSRIQRACKRKIYRCILPNRSFVKLSGIRLYKFTSDGQHLLGFMRHQKGVEVYKYMGVENCSGTEAVFDEIFRHKHSILVATNVYEVLIRHLMLITKDRKYVIVSSVSGQIQNVTPVDMYQTNESMTTTESLHNYMFYCISLETGKCTGTYHMSADKISTEKGITIWGDKLCILSTQHQLLTVLWVTNEGKFCLLQKIGRFCNNEDKKLLPNADGPAYTEVPYCVLKHKLLVHLWKRAGNDSLTLVFNNWNILAGLRMKECQYLDEDHILLKYGTESLKPVTGTANHLNPILFVVYNVTQAEIICAIDEKDPDLMKCILDYLQYFNPDINSIMSIELLQRLTSRDKTAERPVCLTENLPFLPFPCQNFYSSPYFEIFRYPHTQLTHEISQAVVSSGSSIRFLTKGGRFGFDLQLTDVPDSALSYIFHPTDPLIITTQTTKQGDIFINLHVRYSDD